jgi:hypothetical protein
LIRSARLRKSKARIFRSGLFVLPLMRTIDHLGDQLMSRMTVIVFVKPPPVPVIVIFLFPSDAFVPTFTVKVEVPEPGAGIGLGLNVTVCRGPCPVADNVITELKLPEAAVVTVNIPVSPLATVIVEGDAVIVKLGLEAFTMSDTVVVWVMVPEVPFTVMS